MDKKVFESLEKAANLEQLSTAFNYTNPNQSIYHYFRHHDKMNETLELMGYSHHFGTEKFYFFFMSPEIPSIDVYLNNKKCLDGISYNEIGNFINILPGKYQIDVFTSGNTPKKLARKVVFIQSGHSCISVLAHNLGIYSYDSTPIVPQNESKIRFLHLSPTTSTVDIAVKNRDVVFSNLSYLQISEYLGITPMTIDLELRISGEDTIIHSLPNMQFLANKVYTLILIGHLGEKLDVAFLVENL